VDGCEVVGDVCGEEDEGEDCVVDDVK